MHSNGNEQATISELTKILEVTRDVEKDKDNDLLYADKDIPMTTLRILKPKVPRQDTSMYEDWHWRDAHKRKAIHIERAEEDVNHLLMLVVISKRHNLMAAVLDNQVKLSNIVKARQKGERRGRGKDQETSAHELDKVRNYAVWHTNYNISTTTVGIIGIYDLVKEVKIFSESDSTSEVVTYYVKGRSTQST